MEPNLIIALALAVLVGVSLGMLGGGGSILTVPILTYVAGFEPQQAISASLFIVGVTSAVSVFHHARVGRVRWRTGLIFGVAGMAGAFAGGIVGGFIPGTILMVLFAAMMVATATAMIRGRKKVPAGSIHEPTPLPVIRIIRDGFFVGIAAGLVGAGGGFLIVPALTLLGGLPVAVAVGTSLLVIAMQSSAGLIAHLFTVDLPWPTILAFTGIAVAGSFVGAALAVRIPETALRKGFGIFVLVIGAFVLVQEVPRLIPLVTGA